MAEEDKKNNSLKARLAKGDATALLAFTYTIGFLAITAYMIIHALLYTLAGILIIPTIPGEIFQGLLTGELTILGYYFMARHNENNNHQ